MLNTNFEFGFDLSIKGFINIDGIKSDLDLHVRNTENEDNEEHKFLFNKIQHEAVEAIKAGIPVSYDFKIKGFLIIVGVKVEIEKEFKSEDINKA